MNRDGTNKDAGYPAGTSVRDLEPDDRDRFEEACLAADEAEDEGGDA